MTWCAVAVPAGGGAAAASAHPSDFGTLTVDLLLSGAGLAAVDAAVVPGAGPSYEPFASFAEKRQVAQGVLDALGLEGAGAMVDIETSERYHQVGFTIRFASPAVLPVRLDGPALQRVATEAGVPVTKLSACPVVPADQGPPGVPAAIPELPLGLVITADRPGRASDPRSRSERNGCQVWSFTAADAPSSVVVTGAPAAFAATSAHVLPLLAAALLLGTTGAAFRALARGAGPALAGPRPRPGGERSSPWGSRCRSRW